MQITRKVNLDIHMSNGIKSLSNWPISFEWTKDNFDTDFRESDSFKKALGVQIITAMPVEVSSQIISIDITPADAFEEREDHMVKVETLDQLNAFATECGWENAEHFLTEMGIAFDEIKGRWFDVFKGNLKLERV